MQLSDFDFNLPSHLIAQRPLAQRSASRLLRLSKNNRATFEHLFFQNITERVTPNDLLILNDSKVIPARLYGKKKTGGRVEILVERILNVHTMLAQLRVSKSVREGDEIFFSNGTSLTVQTKHDKFYALVYNGDLMAMVDALGTVPLPHYMRREADDNDQSRYQTVYAKHKGSVAAPTAGLHFDETLLSQLKHKGIDMAFLTLHIGAGTFAPIRVDNITQHQMHAEYFTVSKNVCEKIKRARARGGRVIVVGTTTLRALETAACDGEIKPYAGDTQIFIYPGYRFRCVDVLITNFHLPRSSLFILVCALAGREQILQAYAEAIAHGYRFYSYGDAMWVENHQSIYIDK